MKQYYNLEINILSCIIQKPELMDKTILEDKHFIKHQRLWKFMKAFYKKFKTFDFILMYNVCTNKYKIVDYLAYLVDVEPIVSNFELYEKQLIELYEKKEKEKMIEDFVKDKIFALSNDFYVGNINYKEFKEKLLEIDKKSKEYLENK